MPDWVRYKSVEEVDWARVHLAGAPPHPSYSPHQWVMKRGPKTSTDTGRIYDGYHKRLVSLESFYHDYLQPRHEGDETAEFDIKVCIVIAVFFLHIPQLYHV
jgi:hypothetical protein